MTYHVNKKILYKSLITNLESKQLYKLFLIKNSFKRENMDTTLFLKKENESLLVVQVYVDDIIFGATKQSLCEKLQS